MTDVVGSFSLEVDDVRFTRIGARLEGSLDRIQQRYGWPRQDCEQFALDCVRAGITNEFHVRDLAVACERGPEAYHALLDRLV